MAHARLIRFDSSAPSSRLHTSAHHTSNGRQRFLLALDQLEHDRPILYRLIYKMVVQLAAERPA